MYNLAVKFYGNGTLQLIYYSNGVYCKADRPPDKWEEEADDPPLYDDDVIDYSPWGDAVMEEWTDAVEEAKTEYTEEELRRRHEKSVASSFNRAKKRIYDYGRNNAWEWFFTFTLSGDAVRDRTDYRECSLKVRKWLNNIQQRKCPDMRYLVVPETHKSGGWHFHALVSGVDELSFEVAKNNRRTLKRPDGTESDNPYYGLPLRTHYPDGDYIYNIRDYKAGFSTATKIKDTKKAVSYIVKYITKDLCNVTSGHRRYYPSKNLELPERRLWLLNPRELPEFIAMLEESNGVKLVEKCTKSIKIEEENYTNEITYYELE